MDIYNNYNLYKNNGEDARMEVEQDKEFKENLVKLMEMQQQANKNNLILQIANFIIGVFLFIFMIIIIVLK